MMRRLNVVNRKQTLKVVKELDAFPKIPENYTETTATGGGLSILTFIFITILVISEVRYYGSSELKFDYEVDTAVDGKLKINIDMTVAMKCEIVGADVLDLTGQDIQSFGELKQEPANFELTKHQQIYQKLMHNFNRYTREDYHAIHEILWLTGAASIAGGMPQEDALSGPADACRIYGTLIVNKVAGNFHITAGKSIPVFPRGHAHLAIMIQESDYNFSHRINHFSFGDRVTGIMSPLDGEELITEKNYHIFQYFMQVVPTEVRTYSNNLETYQYAVSERNRTIDHSKGSHGVPGIFVKYDLSSLKIRVREEHKPYGQFLVRLCGIIGGMFTVSGMLHSLIGFLVDIMCCQFKWGKYEEAAKGDNIEMVPLHTLDNCKPLVQTATQQGDVNLLPQT